MDRHRPGGANARLPAAPGWERPVLTFRAMAAASEADTIIIVGGDALALGTARELCAAAEHRVAVLWPEDAEFAAAVEGVGARFVAGRPESHEGLVRAGVHQVRAILALS